MYVFNMDIYVVYYNLRKQPLEDLTLLECGSEIKKKKTSLTNAPIYLKTSTYIAQTCLEGSLSQNVFTGLNFCFMVCRRREFENCHKKITKVLKTVTKKSQKLPIICHIIRTRA